MTYLLGCTCRFLLFLLPFKWFFCSLSASIPRKYLNTIWSFYCIYLIWIQVLTGKYSWIPLRELLLYKLSTKIFYSLFFWLMVDRSRSRLYKKEATYLFNENLSKWLDFWYHFKCFYIFVCNFISLHLIWIFSCSMVLNEQQGKSKFRSIKNSWPSLKEITVKFFFFRYFKRT